MTRFTVVWHRAACEELTRLWVRRSDRAALTHATHRIDSELAEDANRKGAEVSEGLRQLTVAPLRVLFVVREDDRIVEVESVAGI
ncbi:MAG TPA: hypothetical protein VF170_13650 [Planctomycetaceae bacterium]